MTKAELPKMRVLWETGDGQFNDKDFSDIVHFTETGIEKIYEIVENGITES